MDYKKLLMCILCLALVVSMVACNKNTKPENEISGSEIVESGNELPNVDEEENKENEEYDIYFLNDRHISKFELKNMDFSKSLNQNLKYGDFSINEDAKEFIVLEEGKINLIGFEGKAVDFAYSSEQLLYYGTLVILNDKGQVFINSFENYPEEVEPEFIPKEWKLVELKTPSKVEGLAIIEYFNGETMSNDIVLKFENGQYGALWEITDVFDMEYEVQQYWILAENYDIMHTYIEKNDDSYVVKVVLGKVIEDDGTSEGSAIFDENDTKIFEYALKAEEEIIVTQPWVMLDGSNKEMAAGPIKVSELYELEFFTWNSRNGLYFEKVENGQIYVYINMAGLT